MYDDVIVLRSVSATTDDTGDSVPAETDKQVFATIKSIGQSEFYQAQTTGLKPEIKFVLSCYEDYNNEQEVIYNGMKYKVLRTFRNGDSIEITVYGGVRYAGA